MSNSSPLLVIDKTTLGGLLLYWFILFKTPLIFFPTYFFYTTQDRLRVLILRIRTKKAHNAL